MARKAARARPILAFQTQRFWIVLLLVLIVVPSLLTSATTRNWLVTAFANVAIVGGIVAAPIISLVAWIGVALPVHTPLHQAAPTLFIGAILWTAMGIVSAHARHEDTAER